MIQMAKAKTSKSQLIREALKSKWAKKLSVAQIAKKLHTTPGLIYAVKRYDSDKKIKRGTMKKYEFSLSPDNSVDQPETLTTASVDYPTTAPMDRISMAIHTLQRAQKLLDLVEGT
jgi:hypothetical protein